MGFTGLHVAAFFGNIDILTLLWTVRDWDMNRRDSAGRTPLVWAVMSGRLKVVKMLLDLGVSVREKDNEGRTPLSWAAGNGYDKIARALLRKDQATFRIVDNNSRTPLLWAAMSGKEDIVNLLLKKEQNVGWVDSTGQTAAAANGHEGVVKILLQQKNVNLDVRD